MVQYVAALNWWTLLSVWVLLLTQEWTVFRFNNHDFTPLSLILGLLEEAVNQARAQEVPVKVGNVFSADLFYLPKPTFSKKMEKLNVAGQLLMTWLVSTMLLRILVLKSLTI